MANHIDMLKKHSGNGRIRGLLRAILTIMVLWLVVGGWAAEANTPPSGDYQRLIEEDWFAQEARKKRTPDSPAAIREAWQRAEMLIDDLRTMAKAPSFEG